MSVWLYQIHPIELPSGVALDSQIQKVLREYGARGWELVQVLEGSANSTRSLPIARNQSDTVTLDAPSRAQSGCSATQYAPQYAPCPQALDQRSSRVARLISCEISELQPHPSYVRHKLPVDLRKLSVLADLGDRAFCDPLMITRDRIIIDGYSRWEFEAHRSKSVGLFRIRVQFGGRA